MANLSDVASLAEAAELLDLSRSQTERVLVAAGIEIEQLPGEKGAKIVWRSQVKDVAEQRLAAQEAALVARRQRLQPTPLGGAA